MVFRISKCENGIRQQIAGIHDTADTYLHLQPALHRPLPAQRGVCVKRGKERERELAA